MKKNSKQRNQIKILKKKEIIIYKNGKVFKHFKREETKKLKDNEMYLLDYLLNKYMDDEVDIESDKSASYENNKYFEINSKEDFSMANKKSKKIDQSYENEVDDEIEEDTNQKIEKKYKNINNKNKLKELSEEEDEGEENTESNVVKSAKNKKKRETEKSNEFEENENEEKSIDSNTISSKKGKKHKTTKKAKNSDNENEVDEERIKKRIISRSKDQSNKFTKKSITKIIHGDVTEIKDLKNSKKKENIKSPLKEKSKNNEYYLEENNEDFEVQGKKFVIKKEYIPQYIEQLQSYTSPTFKFLDEKIAEQKVLNGIPSSLFIKGKEIEGILFFDKYYNLCFISNENDDKEVDIALNNIKKIYFNVKDSANSKNYSKRSNSEKIIQLIEINNKINDIKFNNEEDYEYLIKGLIQIFKNKTEGLDKNLIYQIAKRTIKKNTYEPENKYENNNYKNIKKLENNYYNSEQIKNNESNYINNNIDNFNNNNKNEEEDIIITTTITEVFKDGELINKETREKMDGVMKSLHIYSPDNDEYQVFLKNTKLGQNQMIKRYNDGLPIEQNNNANNNINSIENEEYNIKYEEEN